MKAIIIILAIFTVPIAIIVGIDWLGKYSICSSQASKMELEHSWGPLQNCMIKIDGKWMLLDSYKVVKLRP